jgi:hypothetical protein
MRDNKVNFRHILLYELWKGNNATTATKHICNIYREGAVLDRSCCKWFSRFHEGDVNLNEEPCTGCPSKIDDLIYALIENDRHWTA